jgi:predicted transcriptional regulator
MISKGLSITLLVKQIEDLDELTTKKERSRNWLIRKAVEEYLERENKKEVNK